MITEGTPCPHHPRRRYDAGSRWRPVPEHWSCSAEPVSPTPPVDRRPVETGWSTVVDADQASAATTPSGDSQARAASPRKQDCPDQADPSQSGPDQTPSQDSPRQDSPSQSVPSQDGDL